MAQTVSQTDSELPSPALSPISSAPRLSSVPQLPGVGSHEERARHNKQGVKANFTLGDYRPIARNLEKAARELVDACDIRPGQSVLDVAAGTGNAAILAARGGARVTACDLTPAMIAWGRARCRAEGIKLNWMQADAQFLPFMDNSLHCVTMAFGPSIHYGAAPVFRELYRVVRPDGVVATVSWAPEGFAAKLGGALAKAYGFVPAQRTANCSPELDGDAQGGSVCPVPWRIQMERGAIRNYFDSFERLLDFYETNMGSFVSARQRLPKERYDEVVNDIRRLVSNFNLSSNGKVVVDSDYEITIARRAGVTDG